MSVILYHVTGHVTGHMTSPDPMTFSLVPCIPWGFFLDRWTSHFVPGLTFRSELLAVLFLHL